MLTRYVVRGFFRPRVELEIADNGTHECAPGIFQLHKPWRRATAVDVAALAKMAEDDNARLDSGVVFPRGCRVQASSRSGFHRGATGKVVFQEPRGGKVWVLRDGATTPCFFYADELEQVGRNNRVNTRCVGTT